MANKNTAKRVAAMRMLQEITKKNHSHHDSEVLYDTLESMGYWWDSAAGQWKQGNPPSTSVFLNDEGASTGVIKLRVMGLPGDFDHFITTVRADGWSLIETSDPYENRKGPGYRWYLTFKKDGV